MILKRLIATLTLILALIIGIWAGVSMPDVADPHFSRPEIGLLVATTVLDIGAIALFFTGLLAYKPGIKLAYFGLTLSITLNALGAAQFPIIDSQQLWDSPWVRNGGAIVPFIIATILVYLSIRSFAKILKVKGWLMKPYVVIPLCLFVAILTVVLPHVATSQLETELDANNMIQVWGGTLNLAAAFLILQVWRTIGDHYKRAAGWLMAVLFGSSMAFFVNVSHTLLFVGTKDGITLALYILAAAVSACWLAAGYTFARTRDY
jgi:hypothetical protein